MVVPQLRETMITVCFKLTRRVSRVLTADELSGPSFGLFYLSHF